MDKAILALSHRRKQRKQVEMVIEFMNEVFDEYLVRHPRAHDLEVGKPIRLYQAGEFVKLVFSMCAHLPAQANAQVDKRSI